MFHGLSVTAAVIFQCGTTANCFSFFSFSKMWNLSSPANQPYCVEIPPFGSSCCVFTNYQIKGVCLWRQSWYNYESVNAKTIQNSLRNGTRYGISFASVCPRSVHLSGDKSDQCQFSGEKVYFRSRGADSTIEQLIGVFQGSTSNFGVIPSWPFKGEREYWHII